MASRGSAVAGRWHELDDESFRVALRTHNRPHGSGAISRGDFEPKVRDRLLRSEVGGVSFGDVPGDVRKHRVDVGRV